MAFHRRRLPRVHTSPGLRLPRVAQKLAHWILDLFSCVIHSKSNSDTHDSIGSFSTSHPLDLLDDFVQAPNAARPLCNLSLCESPGSLDFADPFREKTIVESRGPTQLGKLPFGHCS